MSRPGNISPRRQVLPVLTPLTSNQLQGSKSQECGFLKIGQKHPHEPNVVKSLYVARFSLIFSDRDLELIPGHFRVVPISEAHARFPFVRDVVASHLHQSRT